MALMGGRRRWALAARCPNAIADSSSQGARKTIPTSAGISVNTMETLDCRLRTVTGWAQAPQIPSATNSHRPGRSPPAGLRPANSREVQKRCPHGQNGRRCEGAQQPGVPGAPIRRHLVARWLVQLPGSKDGCQIHPGSRLVPFKL